MIDEMHNLPEEQLELFKKGQRLDTVRPQLNKGIDAVNRMATQMRSSFQVTPASRGVIRQSFIISAVRRDYLLCRTWDGTTRGDTDIKVLKPWKLRRTPFHEQTRGDYSYEFDTSTDALTRVSTDTGDSSTEDQVVTPTYTLVSTAPLENDLIIGERPIVDGFDLEEDAEDAEWVDSNSSARAWAKESA